MSQKSWGYSQLLIIFFIVLSLVSLTGCKGASRLTMPQNSSSGSGGSGNPPATGPSTTACAMMSLGAGASFNGFVSFPGGDAWNQDVSAQAVDPNSASIISYIGSSAPLHPDFGTGGGIPYIIVDSSATPLVNLSLNDASESDLMPMPFTSNAPIEAGSDHHVLVVDRHTCFLYEVFEGAFSNGSWSAANSAVWDLVNDENRPATWTSADAAGLPILPGLVRYDEVASGAIKHAIRFTVPKTKRAYLPPATHWAPTDANSPIPMGMRVRLKGSVDISGYSAANQVILKAMKTYGLILADNGSAMYVTGAPDSRWNDSDLHNLTKLTASDFEVVKMGTEISDNNVPSGAAPKINSFKASPTSVAAGTPVTLSWDVTGASYEYIDPAPKTDIGVVRISPVVVSPTATTTYVFHATNGYGTTTTSVTVTVQ